MPPRYLRRSSPTHLKKCAEFPIEVCDKLKADGCCGVLPCRLCLTWETYTDGISYGSAEFGTASWTGTVGGIAFTAYWEVGYESGECEFVVIFNDEEVYRASCYEGASCRDPSGSADVTIDYEDGVLSWSVHEPRELALIDNPDTGCKTTFCGGCHCSCDCVCVTLTDPYGTVFRGESCDSAYECDPPVWSGSLGGYSFSFALGRDEYGECIISATVDGEDLEPVYAGGCGSMSATIELYDGTVISVACKECACLEEIITIPCCEDIPITAETLNARLEGIEAFGPEGQFSGCTWEGPLPLITSDGPYFRTWAGIIPLTVNGGCFNCCDDIVFFLHVICDGTQDHYLCVSFWYANTVSGYTLTPLDEGHTGWVPGTGNADPSTFQQCAPLTEFVEGTETVFASCSPLMMYSEEYATHTVTISELALP